jgi:uncharacterized membrane protein YedE/YeeE
MTPATVLPSSSPARRALALPLGIALGFSLSRIGFTDYGELHRMFVFADLRLFLVFMGAVLVTGLGTLALGRWRTLPDKRVHRGAVAGGVLFGVGWAIAGACPGAAFAQLGEGKLTALVSIAGIVLGSAAFLVATRPSDRSSPGPSAALQRPEACG